MNKIKIQKDRKIIKKNKYLYLRWLLSTLIILLCLNSHFLFAEENETDILIFLDGEEVEELEAQSFIHNSRIMVPVRLVSEVLGAKVEWVNDENIIIIYDEDKTLYIPIGEYQYVDNGYDVDMDVEAFIKDSRAYVPIKFVSNALDVKLEWIGSENDKGMLFLFSAKFSQNEQKEKIDQILKEYELNERSLNLSEINAINLLNTLKIDELDIEAISTLKENEFQVKYDVDKIIEDSVLFLYSLSKKGDAKLNTLLEEKTDGESKEEIFVDYGAYVDDFLYSDKIVFDSPRTILADDEFFKIYLSAVNLSTNEAHLICFSYGQSIFDENKINIQKIEIIPKYIQDSRIEERNKLDEKKPSEVKGKRRYDLVKANSTKLWYLGDSDYFTRTSFYIQYMNNGEYQKEIRSSYLIEDNWLDRDMKKEYRELSESLAREILDATNLSEEERQAIVDSGFKVNVYPEIRAIDPYDNSINWYRLSENAGDNTPYMEIFTDKEQCSFTKLTRTVLRNSSNEGVLSSIIDGEKEQKKIINVKYLDVDSQKEIKRADKIELYSSDSTYVFKAPKNISDLYDLINGEEYVLSFDLKKEEETKDLIVYYKAREINTDNVDFVLSEWRLSKKIDSILNGNKPVETSLKLIIPRQKDRETFSTPGILTPMRASKFYIKSASQSDFIKANAQKDIDIRASLAYNEISQACDTPILLTRENPSYSLGLPNYSQMANIKFSLNPAEQYSYIPVKKEVKVDDLGRREMSLSLEEKNNVQYEQKEKYYNMAFIFLNHESPAKLAPSYEAFTFFDPSTGEQGVSMPSPYTLTVLPKVMMIYDTEDGKAEASFVNSRQYRQIKPLSNHRSYLSLGDEIRVRMNAKKPRKAYSLAMAMGNKNLPVVDKGGDIQVDYGGKNVLTVSTFNLDMAPFTSNSNHEVYLGNLGLQGGKIPVRLRAYLNDSNSSTYKDVSLIRNSNEKKISHSLEVRSGRVISVDGISYYNLSPRLKNVVDNMKLSDPSPLNNVLGAFARNEGAALNEQKFAELSTVYRHIPQNMGDGWYNEDSSDLVLIERQSSFDLELSQVNLKAPLNIKGLSTPINDRMKYSRGEKTDMNLELFLTANPSIKGNVNIQSAFIIPNAEQ